MTTIALVSAKGAPGVTTTAALIAALWPRPACLVEADPAGGDLRWWQSDQDGQPLRPETGVVSLLSGRRPAGTTAGAGDGAASLLAHAQTLPGGLPVVVGVSSPGQHRALASTWSTLACDLVNAGGGGGVGAGRPTASGELADTASHQGLDVIVDAGRAVPESSALLAAMPLVLLVCRPTVSSIAHTQAAMKALRAAGSQLPTTASGFGSATPAGGQRFGVIVIGTSAERDAVAAALSEEHAHQTSLPDLFIGHIANDPAAADALAGTGNRRLDRSPLVASGRRLVAHLAAGSHLLPGERREADRGTGLAATYAGQDAAQDAGRVSSNRSTWPRGLRRRSSGSATNPHPTESVGESVGESGDGQVSAPAMPVLAALAPSAGQDR